MLHDSHPLRRPTCVPARSTEESSEKTTVWLKEESPCTRAVCQAAGRQKKSPRKRTDEPVVFAEIQGDLHNINFADVVVVGGGADLGRKLVRPILEATTGCSAIPSEGRTWWG